MCLKQSVGQNGVNNAVDVKVVQAALNLSQNTKFQLENNLIVDGAIGAKTIAAIKYYQQQIVTLTAPDGRVDPEGRTLRNLKVSILKGLNADSLTAIMGHGNPIKIKSYLPFFLTLLPQYEVNTPLRISHFLAQVGHESLSLTYTEELASGAAYENRQDLGNNQKGDGVRFKGRGFIQLTGRQNYSDYSDYSGLDLLQKGNEQLISINPQYALDVSLWFWKNRKLNNLADQDDLRTITRRVNGGYNGINDREDYLKRAKFFLMST
jgi:putative chitinase